MKWERCGSVPNRPHNHQREDGWSIYLVDAELLRWSLCERDGKEGPGPSGLAPESIERVLKWADQTIAKCQGTN